MATIKVILDKDETEKDVSEMLRKALRAKAGKPSELGKGESFNDPAMDAVAEHLFKAHEKMLNGVVSEILQLLEIGE